MEIKGNIGETIYVKAKLSMIQVNDSGVVYFAQVDDNGDFIPFAENDVRFEDSEKAEDVSAELPWVEPKPAKPDVIETAVAIPKAEVPEDGRVVIPQTLKKRGRPKKKATVEDLMKKAEKIGG